MPFLIPTKALFGLLAALTILKHKNLKDGLNSMLSLRLNLNLLGGMDILVKERRSEAAIPLLDVYPEKTIIRKDTGPQRLLQHY